MSDDAPDAPVARATEPLPEWWERLMKPPGVGSFDARYRVQVERMRAAVVREINEQVGGGDLARTAVRMEALERQVGTWTWMEHAEVEKIGADRLTALESRLSAGLTSGGEFRLHIEQGLSDTDAIARQAARAIREIRVALGDLDGKLSPAVERLTEVEDDLDTLDARVGRLERWKTAACATLDVLTAPEPPQTPAERGTGEGDGSAVRVHVLDCNEFHGHQSRRCCSERCWCWSDPAYGPVPAVPAAPALPVEGEVAELAAWLESQCGSPAEDAGRGFTDRQIAVMAEADGKRRRIAALLRALPSEGSGEALAAAKIGGIWNLLHDAEVPILGVPVVEAVRWLIDDRNAQRDRAEQWKAESLAAAATLPSEDTVGTAQPSTWQPDWTWDFISDVCSTMPLSEEHAFRRMKHLVGKARRLRDEAFAGLKRAEGSGPVGTAWTEGERKAARVGLAHVVGNADAFPDADEDAAESALARLDRGEAPADSLVCLFCRKLIPPEDRGDEQSYGAPLRSSACELDYGRWVCSRDCWTRAVRMWDEAPAVGAEAVAWRWKYRSRPGMDWSLARVDPGTSDRLTVQPLGVIGPDTREPGATESVPGVYSLRHLREAWLDGWDGAGGDIHRLDSTRENAWYEFTRRAGVDISEPVEERAGPAGEAQCGNVGEDGRGLRCIRPAGHEGLHTNGEASSWWSGGLDTREPGAPTVEGRPLQGVPQEHRQRPVAPSPAAPGAAMSGHACHWPGCPREVPPRLWGCRAHWFRLPKLLRDQIWATYRLGQEIRKDPSPEYLAVARAVQEWIREHEARPVPQPREELRPPTGAER